MDVLKGGELFQNYFDYKLREKEGSWSERARGRGRAKYRESCKDTASAINREMYFANSEPSPPIYRRNGNNTCHVCAFSQNQLGVAFTNNSKHVSRLTKVCITAGKGVTATLIARELVPA